MRNGRRVSSRACLREPFVEPSFESSRVGEALCSGVGTSVV